MAAEAEARRWPRALQPFAARPRLLAGFAIGVIAYFACDHWIERGVTAGLIAWDVGAVSFLAMTFASMVEADHERMKRHAITHDEGRHFILILTLVAAVASVAALGAELATAKAAAQSEAYRVALAGGTIAISWLFVQTVFALHYAHEYYGSYGGGPHKEGLDFPGDDPPDYWDFLHFSIIIGATAQTADITIVSKTLRRVGTVHSLIAFGFNTAILALMINLAASLF